MAYGPAFISSTKFRLQIYDDGAGEYLYDAPVNIGIAGGSQVAGGSGSAGPFVLPSPMAVTKPGLLTIQISNVNTPLNNGGLLVQANPVQAFIGLVFAVPKKCRGHAPTVTRRGVL